MRYSKTLLVSSTLVVACASLVAMVAREPARTLKLEKFGGDPDASYEKSASSVVTAVGGNESGPLAAEEERFALRAYPDTDIPMSLSIGARAAFDAAAARGTGNAAGVWSLYGPSTATVPASLSVYGGGANAQYQTSGRVTAMAIAPTCTSAKCRMWVGAAGGGIWVTDKALAGSQNWRFVSEELGTNAIGALTVDPTDASGNTLYVGTGEPNASGDSAAGLGVYKSVDGGENWAVLPATLPFASGRSIAAVVVDPSNANVLYVATTRGVRGVSSVTGGGTTNPPPPAPALGLYKSSDGGATWTLVWNGNNSLRGVIHVELDQLNPGTVYASAFQMGIWRSTNGGAFENIFVPIAPTQNTDRAEFAVTVKTGATRIYVGDGSTGSPAAQVFRADAVNTKTAAQLVGANNNAGWTSLTSSNPNDPRYGTYNYCTGQCWYDNYIVTPKGYPDVVYLGGSHSYGETYGRSNGRGVVLSTDGGDTFTDMTVEGATPNSAINLHPDHHALVTNPSDPMVFFSGSDGGVVRSNGRFRDVSAQCDARGLIASLTACRRLLSRVPERLYSLNQGLSTLQFQSILADPGNPKNLVGGTQDNGTWTNDGASQNWDETIYGDGGQSGFSSDGTGQRLFNTFTGQANDANFRRGDPRKWVIISGPIISSPEGALFYPPVTADPNPQRAGTIFQGSFSVWRTQNWGGDQADLEARCPEFTTPADDPTCGDFVPIGPAGATSLTAASLGTRAGGAVGAIERSAGDTSSLWVATTTGRVFLSKNADAPASSVTFTRLDTLAANDPQRFVSGIYVDPADGNRAWISYSGYNFNTPAQPGHVFEVRFNPNTNTATWTNIDGGTGPLGDLPVNDVVRDDVTGDLYAATDFGVLVQKAGTTAWVSAGAGLPKVEVAGLTIVPAERVIYAATHGRSAWRMTLP